MGEEGSSGGRPRGFDRGAALDTAMRLFQRHGFEGTTLSMLTKAIGVAPPSLYAAFGSKADLYRETLDLFASRMAHVVPDGDDASGPIDALRTFLRRSVAAVVDLDRGCMVSTGLIACHDDHVGLAAELAERRREIRVRIAALLGRWLPSDEAHRVALYVGVVLQGLAILARDGADVATLDIVAEMALSGLETRSVLVR